MTMITIPRKIHWVMEIVIFRAAGEMMLRGKQRIFLHLGR
jgi:hypothetical protein